MIKQWHILFVLGLFLCLSHSSCSDDDKDDETTSTELPPSLKGSNYYPIILDNISAEKIKDKIAIDYRPDNETRKVYLWADSYTSRLCTEKNFYNQWQGWRSYSVSTLGWSAAAFNVLADGEGIDLTGLDDSYTFHMAIKSKDKANHAVRFLGSNGQLYGFAIGTAGLEGVEPYTDFPRDGEWHEIEVPVKVLFDKGLKYEHVIPSGDLAIFYSGGVTGTTLDIDAVFFYKKGTN